MNCINNPSLKHVALMSSLSVWHWNSINWFFFEFGGFWWWKGPEWAQHEEERAVVALGGCASTRDVGIASHRYQPNPIFNLLNYWRSLKKALSETLRFSTVFAIMSPLFFEVRNDISTRRYVSAAQAELRPRPTHYWTGLQCILGLRSIMLT